LSFLCPILAIPESSRLLAAMSGKPFTQHPGHDHKDPPQIHHWLSQSAAEDPFTLHQSRDAKKKKSVMQLLEHIQAKLPPHTPDSTTPHNTNTSVMSTSSLHTNKGGTSIDLFSVGTQFSNPSAPPPRHIDPLDLSSLGPLACPNKGKL
jgi:hypothetical protein